MELWIAHLLAWLAVLPVSHSSPVVSFAPRAVIIDDASHLKHDYDYVVIGGGTSGLVVANRLTEDPEGT